MKKEKDYFNDITRLDTLILAKRLHEKLKEI